MGIFDFFSLSFSRRYAKHTQVEDTTGHRSSSEISAQYSEGSPSQIQVHIGRPRNPMAYTPIMQSQNTTLQPDHPVSQSQSEPQTRHAAQLIHRVHLQNQITNHNSKPAQRAKPRKIGYEEPLALVANELRREGYRQKYKEEFTILSDTPILGVSLVYKCRLQDRKVAVKVLHRPYLSELRGKYRDDAQIAENLLKIIRRGAGSEHRNIIDILGFINGFEKKEAIGWIIPWYKNGDLLNYVQTFPERGIPINDRFKLMHDVASGLEFLHKQRHVHKDLKAKNVLIDDDGTARISDFAITKHMEENGIAHISTKLISLQWTAPEWLLVYSQFGHNPEPSGDMWSFGCVFLEVLRGKYPYSPMEERQVRDTRPAPPTKPDDVIIHENHWDFMKRCWDMEPSNRPTARDAINYFSKEMNETRIS